jgi:hypothetical protein
MFRGELLRDTHVPDSIASSIGAEKLLAPAAASSDGVDEPRRSVNQLSSRLQKPHGRPD